MVKRTTWALALAVTATVLSAVPAQSAMADESAPGSGKTYTVTLLTGDVATVRTLGSGCPRVTVEPAEPHGVIRQSCGPDGHVRVIPAKVAAQVGPVLDPLLFDVTALIQDGYDDAAASELPVIVKPRANARMAALGDVKQLPSIGSVAGRIPKKTAAGAKQLADSLLTGAEKVWLDRRVRATAVTGTSLDPDLEQIDAPKAWNAGYTGKGAKVAVLDSGADFTHPDLVGRVVDRADFTVEGGDAVDHLGHGTHVASTIAGTGAASHGERRGVAPEAGLLIGKVLDDQGSGTDSQIIAGMEWAAARADVINMSLGGSGAGDGTDPMDLAVDALSERTGALFVIAAGNSGGGVSSPGTATSALTVGAVDGADHVTDFSSRGPVLKSHAAKPELVAPGVDIVAARAAGTMEGPAVDKYYVRSTGTSMATPHVAGAAALLAQRHPDWTAKRLKAALVGAADPLPGTDPYTVGAGRLNAARALSGPVADQGVVNLGTFAYPQSGTGETALSWTGDPKGDADLDLRLTVADHLGAPAPRGAASLSQPRVRLSHGASAGATLRIDRKALAGNPGLYSATVTARTGGKIVTSTPVAFFVEPTTYSLTLTTVPMAGAPPTADQWVNVLVTNLDDPVAYAGGDFGLPGKTFTLRVPPGRYAVTGAYSLYDPETDEQRSSFVGEPDAGITADSALTLDPATAKPVRASIDGVATENSTAVFGYEQTSKSGLSWSDVITAQGDPAIISVGPLKRPGVGGFRAFAAFALDSPAGTADAYHYDLIHDYGTGVPADPSYRVTGAERAELARIDERFDQMDSPGMVTSLRRSAFTTDGRMFLYQNRTYDLPAGRTDYLSPGYLWQDDGIYGSLLARENARGYQAGSRQVKTWARQPLHSDWYDDPDGTEYNCATAPSRTRGNLHVDLVMLTDLHQRADCLAGGTIGVRRTLALYRDGKQVDERDASLADFAVPEKQSDYRLTFDVDTSLILPVSTRVSTAWTFRSAGPSGTGSVPLPLLSVDYALPLDAANHPTGGTAGFTVRQATGGRDRRVTSFLVWTSTDDGATWRSARVRADRDGYRADLPSAAAGQAVSLRVKAGAEGGSGIDQTIIRAYRAG